MGVKRMEEDGRFAPFAITLVRSSGEFHLFEAADHERSWHDPAEVLTSLVEGLRSDHDDLLAFAIVSGQRTSRGPGILVDVEHSVGAAHSCVLLYQIIDADNGEYRYGETLMREALPKIWGVRPRAEP